MLLLDIVNQKDLINFNIPFSRIIVSNLIKKKVSKPDTFFFIYYEFFISNNQI